MAHHRQDNRLHDLQVARRVRHRDVPSEPPPKKLRFTKQKPQHISVLGFLIRSLTMTYSHMAHNRQDNRLHDLQVARRVRHRDVPSEPPPKKLRCAKQKPQHISVLGFLIRSLTITYSHRAHHRQDNRLHDLHFRSPGG